MDAGEEEERGHDAWYTPARPPLPAPPALRGYFNIV